MDIKDYSSGLKIIQPISFPVISAIYELTQKDGRVKSVTIIMFKEKKPFNQTHLP